MNNLDLNSYGLEEMGQEEMVKTDGGNPAIALIICGLWYIAEHEGWI